MTGILWFSLFLLMKIDFLLQFLQYEVTRKTQFTTLHRCELRTHIRRGEFSFSFLRLGLKKGSKHILYEKLSASITAILIRADKVGVDPIISILVPKMSKTCTPNIAKKTDLRACKHQNKTISNSMGSHTYMHSRVLARILVILTIITVIRFPKI